MSKIDISVVIPTKDRSAILKKCLEYLIAQDYPSDKFEIIVIDDNSTDDTEEMTKTISFPCQFKYIKQLSDKRGPAAANNLGIFNSEGKYILFINNDILAKNDLLSQHMKLHKDNNLPAPLAGRFRTENSFPGSDRGIIVQGRAINTISLEDPTIRPIGYTGYLDVSLGYFTTWNCSVPKEILIRAGLFDEDFKNISWEDVEFGFRLRKLGTKQKINKDAIGYHYSPPFKLNEKSLESIKVKSINMGRNAILYYHKHPCLETRISSQVWIIGRIIYFKLNITKTLFGPKRIIKFLYYLESKNMHKPLAFFVGLAGYYWYLRGVFEK